MIVDATAFKAHSRIDFSTDDTLIAAKLAAAQSHIESLLGYRLDEATFPDTDDEDFPATVPAALKEAVLQLAAHWYENREASLVGVTAQTLPMGLEDIIANFRRYSFGEADE